MKKIKFKSEVEFKGFSETKNIISILCNDKQNAESQCYLEFVKSLYVTKKIDDNFRLVDKLSD